MKTICLSIAVIIVVAGATAAVAQTGQAAAGASPAQAALDRAAAAQKYVFIFFWKEKSPLTDRAWSEFQPAAARLANWAEVLSVQISDPAEKQLVDKFGVARAPMPMALAVAPCGAITKSFTKAFDENQLRTAFVSNCTQLCLKALQNRKLVLLCVVDQSNPLDAATIPQGVADFRADPKFGTATEIILVNAHDRDEAALLKDFQIDLSSPKPVVVFLAPPGAMIGKFNGTTTKDQLVAKLAAAQSNPCAGGKCGPNGCGPKK